MPLVALPCLLVLALQTAFPITMADNSKSWLSKASHSKGLWTYHIMQCSANSVFLQGDAIQTGNAFDYAMQNRHSCHCYAIQTMSVNKILSSVQADSSAALQSKRLTYAFEFFSVPMRCPRLPCDARPSGLGSTVCAECGYPPSCIFAQCQVVASQVAVVHNAELDAPLLGQSPRGAADSPMMQDLEDLAQQYASQRTRAELAQAWRPGLNKLDKMMMSLDAWMSHCPVKLRRQFLQKLQPLVQAAWEVYGPPVVSHSEVASDSICISSSWANLSCTGTGLGKVNLHDSQIGRCCLNCELGQLKLCQTCIALGQSQCCNRLELGSPKLQLTHSCHCHAEAIFVACNVYMIKLLTMSWLQYLCCTVCVCPVLQYDICAIVCPSYTLVLVTQH